MKREIKVALRNYEGLKDQFTQVANSMHKHIHDPYSFSVYFYLCMRYNRNYHYSFPSINNIAEECHMSKRKVVDCIKWLSDMEYIEKRNYKSEGKFLNNVYIIRYLDMGDVIEEIINTEEVRYKIIEVESSQLEEELSEDLSS